MGNNLTCRASHPKKTIVLTGAGFTQSFGGYLADQMWAAIFNQQEIKSKADFRKCLLRNLNYEDAYDLIMSPQAGIEGNINNEQRSFMQAIITAYRDMDRDVYQNRSPAENASKQFLRLFRGSAEHEKGFVFTLNQDLFIERFLSFSDQERFWFELPGLQNNDSWFNSRFPFPIPENYRVELPDKTSLDSVIASFRSNRSRLAYVKLHGSYGWFSNKRKLVMVIGRMKTSIIEGEPLLYWYQSLFKQVLQHGGLNLLVIGYSFRDPHINSIIIDAIQNYSLRLYVVSPSLPRDFRDALQGVHSTGGSIQFDPNCDKIWDGLWGYYQGRTEDFFTDDSRPSIAPKAEAFLRELELK